MRQFKHCQVTFSHSKSSVRQRIKNVNKSCGSFHGDRCYFFNLAKPFHQHLHLVRSPMHLPPAPPNPSHFLSVRWSVPTPDLIIDVSMGDQRPDARESFTTFVLLSHAVRGPEPRPSRAPSIFLLSGL